jgi:hypothetical protein
MGDLGTGRGGGKGRGLRGEKGSGGVSCRGDFGKTSLRTKL